MESAQEREKAAAAEAEVSLADFLYEYSWEYFQRSTDHFSKLDAKAASLGGFIGVMLTVVLTLAPSVFPGAKFQSNLGLVSQVLYIASSILLAKALYHCINALKLRKIEDCPKALELIEKSKQLGESQEEAVSGKRIEVKLKRKVAEHLAKAGQQFQEQANSKENALKWTNATMIGGIASLIGAGAIFVVHIIINHYVGK